MSHYNNFAAILGVSGLLLSASAHAGYRNIGANAEAQVPSEAITDMKVAIQPRGDGFHATIVRGSQVTTVANHRGNFSLQQIDALEKIRLRFHKQGIPEGASIFLYTVHGGRINGKLSDTVTVQENGTFEVDFQAGPYSGNYPLGIRYGGADEVLEFWVGDVATDSRRESKSIQKEER